MCTYMLCPDTLVPQDELWPDTSMSLVNNNIIIIVPIRLFGEKHKHVQLFVVGEAK